MATTTAPGVAKGASLKRNLGLWAIVGLGLGYMTPTVIFDTFGMVARDTNNVVPLAYLVALIVMIFTFGVFSCWRTPYKVVVFPDPVGPVTKNRPCGCWMMWLIPCRT